MRIGIDLGGTKTEIIALDDNGDIQLRRRIASPRHDYRATLDAICSLIRETEKQLGQQGTVGIGIPGTISPASGLVKNANSTWLNGRPLQKDLSAALGRTVRLANDANCFTLSEAMDGAAAGAASVFGIILGTGTGGGIVVNDRLVTGPNAIAGEWGHNPLPWPAENEYPGPACWCGKRGCIETWLSGPGLVTDYCRAGGRAGCAEDIVNAATAGESLAIQTLQQYKDRLARALASVINILDPEVIVLGGGMSNIDSLYNDVTESWVEYVFSDQVTTRLLQNIHGDSGGVRGAAWLWPARD